MENPDVELEVSVVDDKSAKLSYKVYSREKDDEKSAIEFIEIIRAIFAVEESEE
jgi:hypothetical protein